MKTKTSLLGWVMLLLTALLYGIGYFAFSLFLKTVSIPPSVNNNPLLIALIISLVVIILEPLRKKLKKLLKLPLLSSNQINPNVLLSYTAELNSATTRQAAEEILTKLINDIFKPDHVHIFLFDPLTTEYTARHQVNGTPTYLSIPQNSIIPKTLKRTPSTFYHREAGQEEHKHLHRDILSDEWGSQVFAPISGSYGVLGWVAIGPKTEKDPYTLDNLQILEAFTHQFSTVYERAESIKSSQSFLQSIEILNNVSTASRHINDLDSFMLTVIKQIEKIVPIDYLSVVIYSEISEGYSRVFQFDQGKVTISASQPLPLAEDFHEKNVILTGFSEMVTNEGARLIFPLLADSKVIAAVSLGHSSQNAEFESLDLNLIEGIANLITGAITQADLMQTSQEQARQLSALHEASRQLVKTVNPDLLLKIILDGALKLVNCSSGILMLIDEHTQELQFKATAGTIGTLFQGKSLPYGEGIAGQSLVSKKPIIVNDLQYGELWLIDTDPEATARIHNILTMPLIDFGKPIGVLELINKANGQPFTISDQEVLESLTNLAVIAVHHSSLYTKKDRALAEQVEELLTMHKIEQDLNATRDINLAMQTFLEAALTQTHAKSGSIGLIDDSFTILEQIWQILPESDHSLSIGSIDLSDLPEFSRDGMNSEIIQAVHLGEKLNLPEEYQWHSLTLSELENDVYVLLCIHLDNPDQLNHQDVKFLTRLNDQAVTALRNALLYENLHDAIQEKNEFISFISHELKNPLTVIKGYADIIIKGMTGSINDEQRDYLTTITHNVRRMNTFIKDLSDQSHIETKSLRLIFEATSINEILNEVLQTFEGQINEKNIRVQKHISDPIPDGWCDRMRLIQILSNLLSNAIKYTPEGGDVLISAEYAHNKWDKNGAAEVIHFSIKDNGFGISPEDQKHLFEKFYRGTNPQIQNIPGTGLGLRISRSLTEMLGGVMWFESSVGEGSTFHFTVPI